MDGVRILQIILFIVVWGVIVFLLRLSRSLKLEKRIAKFAISSIKDEEIAFLDKVYFLGEKLVFKLAKILYKSSLLNKYAEKYNKFIAYEERNRLRGLDYVAFKFLSSILVALLSLFTLVFHYIKFDLMIFVIIIIVSFFIPDIFWNIDFAQKRRKIEDDLLKAIIIMNSAFQSGRNIMQAVEIVKLELDGPIQDEFKKIYLDITYGLSLEVVFERFYERVKLEDAKYITASLTLLNKTGGDIVKVFAMIEKSIFNKKSLKNELNSLTASSQFVFKMLVFMPFILVGIIFLLNPGYFKPFFSTGIGAGALIFIIMLYIFYIVVIRKVLKVKL